VDLAPVALIALVSLSSPGLPDSAPFFYARQIKRGHFYINKKVINK
jgi:hypothetical protein